MPRAADFRMDAGFFAHPKIRRLHAELGSDGVLGWILLLAHASQYKTDGRLTGMVLTDVALAAHWSGDPETFVNHLVDVRLLDRRGKTLAIHDWAENNGYAASYVKRSERARKA